MQVAWPNAEQPVGAAQPDAAAAAEVARPDVAAAEAAAQPGAVAEGAAAQPGAGGGGGGGVPRRRRLAAPLGLRRAPCLGCRLAFSSSFCCATTIGADCACDGVVISCMADRAVVASSAILKFVMCFGSRGKIQSGVVAETQVEAFRTKRQR